MCLFEFLNRRNCLNFFANFSLPANTISSLEVITSEVFVSILIGFLKISKFDVSSIEKAAFHQKFKVASSVSDKLKTLGVVCPITTIVAPSANEARKILSQIVGKLPEENSKLENFESFEDLQAKEKSNYFKNEVIHWQQGAWIHPGLLDKPLCRKSGFPFLHRPKSLTSLPLNIHLQGKLARIISLIQTSKSNSIQNSSSKANSHYLFSNDSIKEIGVNLKLAVTPDEW